MGKAPRQQIAFVLAILAAAVPFAFGVIRAIATGTDYRYLWMAIAAALGGGLVVVATKGARRTRAGMLMRSAAMLGLATVLAGVAGYLLGARAASGIVIVSLSFGLCDAASYLLASLSLHHTNAGFPP